MGLILNQQCRVNSLIYIFAHTFFGNYLMLPNSLKKLLPILILFVTTSVLISCQAPTENGNKITKLQDSVTQTVPEKIPEITNRVNNDVSRYIAGLQPSDGNTLKANLYTDAWKKYATDQDKKWAQLNENHFKAMHEFTANELKSIAGKHDTIFYPFSGPDFLNATTFFPEAQTYYMLALEPPGTLPNLDTVTIDSLPKYFNSIHKSLHAILNFSFFRTLSMEEDFATKELNGAVQLISIFMQRSGHSIQSIESISVDSLGKIITDADPLFASGSRGLHITCINNKSNKIKDVYYFSCDISDLGLSKNKRLHAFLKVLPSVTTYLKSASYLLHKPYFSLVRKTILEKSRFVLQDDSGIPVRFYNAQQWNHQYYGTYDAPINLFKNFLQKDLKMAYDSIEKAQIKPLNFGIGYDYKLNESNLMLFSKKGA
jgi:hypothetical protein